LGSHIFYLIFTKFVLSYYMMRSLLFFVALVAMLLIGCGDLDIALSSGKLYKVNALVNGLTLDECAILSKGDSISPYFDFSVEDDPDIDSLVVYIKDYMGKKAGPGIRYKLRDESDILAPVNEENDENQHEAASGDDDGVLTGESGLDTEITDDTSTETEVLDLGDGSADTDSDVTALDSGTESVVVQENDWVQSDDDIELIVKGIDKILPSLILGNDLKYGAYTIVFEIVASNKTVLNHTEKPFFYIARKKLAIKDIVSYLPGISSAMRIVPPGEKIMLEVDIESDISIDPYIIWYNGKQRISEGFASNGKNCILWTAPVRTVFQNIRVEVFPFEPDKQVLPIPGLSYDVSLPVSQRHGRNGYYSEMENQLSRWYRLWGDIADYKDPVNTASALVVTEGTVVRWLPVSGTYGLAIGADYAYKLPDSFFKQIRRDESIGEILLLFAPQNGSVAEGIVFQAELKGTYADDETDGVCMVWLSVHNYNLVLSASGYDRVVQTRLPLISGGSVFVSAAINFEFSETRTTISIGVGDIETGTIESWESLNVDFTANGEGGVQFGGLFTPTFFLDMEDVSNAYTGVLNEIALRYKEIPLPPASNEEILTDDADELVLHTETSD
jgi:hypothetical protein